jgi:hypothetical protein
VCGGHELARAMVNEHFARKISRSLLLVGTEGGMMGMICFLIGKANLLLLIIFFFMLASGNVARG